MISELLSGNLFHLLNMLFNLSHDFSVDLSSVLIVLRTSFCRNRKALWNRKTDIGHLRKVCSLSAKKLSHACIPFREEVNPLSCHRKPSLCFFLTKCCKEDPLHSCTLCTLLRFKNCVFPTGRRRNTKRDYIRLGILSKGREP